MSNTLKEFSNDLSAAVEKGGASTILVDARKRYPASGIAYAEDLILTADHVVTRKKISKSHCRMANRSVRHSPVATPALTLPCCASLKKFYHPRRSQKM